MKKYVITPYIGLNKSKKSIVMTFNEKETKMYFKIIGLLAHSENKPYINLNDSILKISKIEKQKAITRFIDVKLLKPTKDKNIFKVYKSFMFYGEEKTEIK